jgi:serine/threonine protein kinase/Tol biopolymer transport system component
MTPERWQRIDQLFHAALACEAERRALFLAAQCAGDESLQREVESLISSYEENGSFIETPAGDIAAEFLDTNKSTFEAGHQIQNYQIVRRLGSGGMGEVYLAEDIRLKRKIALKVLPPHFTVNPDRVRRFEREARAASALNHPNIVTVHEIGKSESTHFIATEFVDGKTLRQLINEKPFKLRESINVALQVAGALSAAHSAGIVHRDIKPENIMIRTDGLVKILDFGLAKLADTPTTSAELETPTLLQSNPGLVMGTVQYMSPEQARGKNVDARTDIWSFGIVLYELLAGQVPFSGETPSHVMVALMEDELPPLTDSANVPAELDRVVTRALRKKQRERYQAASEIARDLRKLKEELQLADLKGILETVPHGSLSSKGSANAQTTTPGRVGSTDPQARQKAKWLPTKTSLKWAIPVTIGLILLVSIAVVLSLNRRSTPSSLKLPQAARQVTNRDGFISASRFAADGKSIIYSAGFDGKPVELFIANVDGSDLRSFGIKSAALKSVSRSGKIAVLFDFELNWADGYNGTLAILPTDGGKPEIIGDGIDDAAFAPDGNTFAIIRSGMGEQQLEYPIGQVLYKSEGWMSNPRFSPKGDKIAFFEHPLGDFSGSIAVFDLNSQKKIDISTDWKSLKGLAWNPKDNEIWFGGGRVTKKQSINAVSLSGQLQMNLYEVPAMHARIEDISEDGKILIAQGSNHTNVMIVEGKSATKAIDSQFSWSTSADLSADGKTLLYYEGGYESSDPADVNTVYLRKLDSGENIKLGPGKALALSPDGKSALALQTNPQPQLVILSTTESEPKILPNQGIREYHYASFFPDGRQILFTGVEAHQDAAIRSYVQDINTGDVRPLTEELTVALRVSPDGKSVITLQPDRTYYIQPLDGSQPTPIPGLESGDEPIQWSDDGRSVYVIGAGEFATKIYRVSLGNGNRREWKEIDPPNKVGLVGLETNRGGILITSDGKVSVYTYWVLLQQLITKSLD